MSYQERLNITELIALISASAIYAYIVFAKYQSLGLNETNDFRFWGIVIVILFFVLLLSQIVGYIVFLVINSLSKKKIVTIEDEFDKVIDRKAMAISFYIFAVSFFASMGLLIFSLPPRAAFISMSICFILSSAAAFVSKILMYQRGV